MHCKFLELCGISRINMKICLKLVSQQHQAWSECMNVYVGLALCWWQQLITFVSSRLKEKKTVTLYHAKKNKPSQDLHLSQTFSDPDHCNHFFNPFPHTAILRQTTFRKILNVHSAERNEHFLSWKALKTLWQRKQEQFLPLSQCFQMSSAVADVKTSYLWSKGLNVYISLSYTLL